MSDYKDIKRYVFEEIRKLQHQQWELLDSSHLSYQDKIEFSSLIANSKGTLQNFIDCFSKFWNKDELLEKLPNLGVMEDDVISFAYFLEIAVKDDEEYHNIAPEVWEYLKTHKISSIEI